MADVAVEMAITRPWELKTGPPLLPGLIGAVICRYRTPAIVRSPPMIPVDTVPSSPCGLPRTTTSWPAAAVSESASSTAGVDVNVVWIVTRSYLLAKFRIFTATPFCPRQRTSTLAAPLTTCALVTSTPSRVMKKPLPSASGWSRSSSAISVTTEGRFSRAILAATGSCSCAAAGAVTGSIVASARPATTPTRRAEDIDRIARRVVESELTSRSSAASFILAVPFCVERSVRTEELFLDESRNSDKRCQAKLFRNLLFSPASSAIGRPRAGASIFPEGALVEPALLDFHEPRTPRCPCSKKPIVRSTTREPG